MTEDQAKQTWCPFARMEVESILEGKSISITGANRGMATFNANCNCLGSGCQMWIWLDDQKLESREGQCGLIGVRIFD